MFGGKMKKKVSKKGEPYHLLVYVLDSSSKIKRFDSTLEMGKFIDDFYKKYPDYLDTYSDNWIDYTITGITGEVFFFTNGLEVE